VQGRELADAELEDALGRREVLEAMHAEIDEHGFAREGCRRRRHHRLASVSRRSDPGIPMDVCPDIGDVPVGSARVPIREGSRVDPRRPSVRLVKT
jgi:hypothetical protein